MTLSSELHIECNSRRAVQLTATSVAQATPLNFSDIGCFFTLQPSLIPCPPDYPTVDMFLRAAEFLLTFRVADDRATTDYEHVIPPTTVTRHAPPVANDSFLLIQTPMVMFIGIRIQETCSALLINMPRPGLTAMVHFETLRVVRTPVSTLLTSAPKVATPDGVRNLAEGPITSGEPIHGSRVVCMVWWSPPTAWPWVTAWKLLREYARLPETQTLPLWLVHPTGKTHFPLLSLLSSDGESDLHWPRSRKPLLVLLRPTLLNFNLTLRKLLVKRPNRPIYVTDLRMPVPVTVFTIVFKNFMGARPSPYTRTAETPLRRVRLNT